MRKILAVQTGSKSTIKKIFISLFFSILLIPFFSCSFGKDGDDLLSSLEKVDALISAGQSNEAFSLLKKNEKKAYSPYARIGIFNRYVVLEKFDMAEKALKNAHSILPESLEISAVYAHFLLRQERYEESIKIAENLKKSKYASIYSEALLKLSEKNSWFSEESALLYKTFFDATKNEQWLVNAAVVCLLQGKYSQAGAMQKQITGNNALFWAKVHFDAGNYDLCIENLEKDRTGDKVLEKALIASDSFWNLSDFDSGERYRKKITGSSSNLGPELEFLYVNSALWAYSKKDYIQAYEMLMKAFSENPYSVPALLTYAKFSKEEFRGSGENYFTDTLRSKGLKTLSMTAFDDRPKFLVKDALAKIQCALDYETANNMEKSGELLVEKLDLFLLENSSRPVKVLENEIWRTLEENQRGTNLYPAQLMDFAVSKLISFGNVEEAENLFFDYIDAKYKGEPEKNLVPEKKYDIFGGEITYKDQIPNDIKKAAFGDRAEEYAGSMEIWELEKAAWFALNKGNVSSACKLYEYVLFETGGMECLVFDDTVAGISSYASVTSAVNLAGIYEAQGKFKKALSLYGIASGKTRDKKLKSKILYKTAGVQLDLGNSKGAVLSLDYAVSLDENNAEARLLRNKIKGM